MEKIYNPSMVNMLLGCLLIDNSLADSSKYPLDKDDFCVQYQKIIFAFIKHLYKNGNKSVGYFELDTIISKYPAQYEVFKDCGGRGGIEEYLEMIQDLSDVDNFEYYYKQVRKLSCLRDYRDDDGHKIDKFWDINKSDEDNLKDLETVSIEDILDYFEALQSKKVNKYKIDEDTKDKKFGENGLQIYKSFKDAPIVTAELESKYLTTLWNGFGRKQLFIRSGDTSSGKSRSCLGDLIGVCATEKYDIETKQWIKNKNGGHRGLYIGCEMELDEEVEPLVWAYISGVESSTIIHRRETKEEDERIKKAIEITERDGIWGCDMPSFNIRKIEDKIRYYKKNHDIEYLAFDYILLNSAVVKEFVQNRGKGIGARGDEILLEISEALKNLAKKYDIGIITATQVNADIKDYRNRDYQVLRGGKAIADKASGGSISMPITPQELKLVEPYVLAWNKKHNNGLEIKEPNWVETVYKSRFSEFPKECKIFSYYNLGNMRREEMFVTSKEFQILKDVPKTYVENT